MTTRDAPASEASTLDDELIEVTPLAAEKLRELRTGDAARAVLRVYVAGRSCCGPRLSIAFDDAASDDDALAEPAGIPVAVDPVSLPFVRGATVDWVETAEGTGFMVTGPEQAGGGGCACARGGH